MLLLVETEGACKTPARRTIGAEAGVTLKDGPPSARTLTLTPDP